MKFILTQFILLQIVYSGKICTLDSNYECGENEMCLKVEDQVMCCPFQGILCPQKNTCCPNYVQYCSNDGIKCTAGSFGKFEAKIQMVLKQPRKLTPLQQQTQPNNIIQIIDSSSQNLHTVFVIFIIGILLSF